MPSAHSDQSPLAFPIISCHYLFISFLLSPHVSLKLGFCCISWDPFDLWTQPWQMHSIDSVRRKTLHIGSPIVWSLDQEFVEQYQQCIYSPPPFNLNNTSYHLLKWVFGVLTETWACSRLCTISALTELWKMKAELRQAQKAALPALFVFSNLATATWKRTEKVFIHNRTEIKR